jgi:hypothetical protein
MNSGSEHRVLRGIFVLQIEEPLGELENVITRNFIIYTTQKIFLNHCHQIKDYAIGSSRSMHGEDTKCRQNLSGNAKCKILITKT